MTKTERAVLILEDARYSRYERAALEEAATDAGERRFISPLIERCKRREAKAVKMIERAEDPVHKQILYMHYIEGQPYPAIAEKLMYSERHLYNLRRAALESMTRR